MLNMKYIGDKVIYPVEFDTISNNVVELRGDFPIFTDGFTLSRPDHDDNWDYSAYTTVYYEIDGGAQFSNDGSIYTPPEPAPEPEEPDYEPYEPTLEEIKEQKISEMNTEQQKIIQHGVEVPLSDGTTERFTLKDQDQMSLMGLQTLAQQGVNQIPWHDADNAEHCKYYSAEDMNRITGTALSFISYQVTYFRDLRIYINSMLDKESVQSVTYGTYIPQEYQSEVLADFYAAQNAQAYKAVSLVCDWWLIIHTDRAVVAWKDALDNVYRGQRVLFTCGADKRNIYMGHAINPTTSNQCGHDNHCRAVSGVIN